MRSEHSVSILRTALVTHSHFDHAGGLLDAVEALGCDELLYNHDAFIASPTNSAKPDPVLRAYLRKILDLGDSSKLGPAIPGTTRSIGAISYWLLAPSHRNLTKAVVTRKTNAASGVVVIEVDGIYVVIGGDADASVWKELLASSVLPQNVLVLRWPHHGGELGKDGPATCSHTVG